MSQLALSFTKRALNSLSKVIEIKQPQNILVVPAGGNPVPQMGEWKGGALNISFLTLLLAPELVGLLFRLVCVSPLKSLATAQCGNGLQKTPTPLSGQILCTKQIVALEAAELQVCSCG